MQSRSKHARNNVEHLQKMFELAGDKPEAAVAEAKPCWRRKGLAQAAMTAPRGAIPKARS